MIDVAGLAAGPGVSLTTGDFVFRAGNDSNPAGAGWAAAPPPALIDVRRGGGVNGSDRITVVWPDGSIVGQWLQVTVKANSNTGLGADDVFYFGNAIGETGNSAADARVTDADETLVRANPRTSANPAPATFRYDLNRDKLVNAADQMAVRSNRTTAATALRLIVAPAGEEAAGAAALATTTATADPVPPAATLVPRPPILRARPLFSPVRIRGERDEDAETVAGLLV